MLITDYKNRKIPEYYDTMYLDGYTPTEIMIASQKLKNRVYQDRIDELNEIDNINIACEVKKK